MRNVRNSACLDYNFFLTLIIISTIYFINIVIIKHFSGQTHFFFCWETHIFWDGLFWRDRSIISWNAIQETWLSGEWMWGCNFQCTVIKSFWHGMHMTWPLWKSCRGWKWRSGFLCCSWSYRNWYLDFQNPHDINGFHLSVQWNAGYHLFWFSAIDREWAQRSSEGWSTSFFLLRKLLIWSILSQLMVLSSPKWDNCPQIWREMSSVT